MNVYPVGNFGVTCSKAGFDNLTAGPFAFVQGTTLNQNFALLENLNPPVNVTAVLNAGETAVDINWGLPVGNYELLYDDGGAENFTVWAVGGNQNAVKFTPVGYPATVYGGKVNIGTIDNYPSGSNPLVPFKIAVYDVAANGMPGTALDTTDVTPAGFGWVEFTLNTPITVTSGSFFLVMIQGGNFPDAAGILIDETNTQLRSYARFVTGGGPWIPASGNFMMRAMVNGAGGPLLLDGSEATITGNANPNAMYDHMPVTVTGVEGVGSIIPLNGDNTDQITGYQVWRLKQGEEGTPGLWTSIGTPAATSIVDNGWPSLPCGPYRWAVKAQYTGNRWSADAFSNVIGKCWVADITVNVTLTCAAHDEEGTFVKLQNNAYPDTVYVAQTDTNGQVIFDNVWKGNYTLSAWRFNYTTYTQVLDITGDATIDLMLLQDKTPPTNLFVDDRSLEAVWNAPRAAVTMFNEAWASGSFATNQWTTSGGSNWTMTTGVGNPAPSAMFNWTPQVTNYNQYLTSKQFTGLYSPHSC